LSAELETERGNVAALTKERDEAVAGLAKLEADARAAAEAAEATERAALVKQATESGKAEPAQVKFLESLNLEQLRAYTGMLTVSALLTKQATDDKGAPAAALTKEEAEAAAAMGVTAEDFKKAKEV
ncbi:MAG: hypothetical protein LBU45_04925, partial [Azoarcus sp.]|nr:hypothetical protein [Azoarcus sp.]